MVQIITEIEDVFQEMGLSYKKSDIFANKEKYAIYFINLVVNGHVLAGGTVYSHQDMKITYLFFDERSSLQLEDDNFENYKRVNEINALLEYGSVYLDDSSLIYNFSFPLFEGKNLKKQISFSTSVAIASVKFVFGE